jgi:hypothetical protein
MADGELPSTTPKPSLRNLNLNPNLVGVGEEGRWGVKIDMNKILCEEELQITWRDIASPLLCMRNPFNIFSQVVRKIKRTVYASSDRFE